jgi:uncharacterized protein
MNRTYIDTSVWVAMIAGELFAGKVKNKFEQMIAHELCLSDWVLTEFASALSLKRRRQELSDADMERNHQSLEGIAATLTNLSITSVDYIKAASLCRDHASKLRASDALHLAVALRHKCTLMFSLDDVLNAQAIRHGLRVVDL